jgi:methionyl-tRNA formyltransferase
LPKNSSGASGTVKTDNKTFLSINTADGSISIDELQLEGKKRMKTEEFFRGNKIVNC